VVEPLLDPTQKRILEIVLEQRSVSDDVIAPQVQAGWTEDDVGRLTVRLRKQGLLAETAYASDRWTITDEGRSALDAAV
jgi:hypothetical protein